MQETQVQILGQDDPLEEAVSTHSKLLSSVQLIVTPWKPVLFLPRESHGQRSLKRYSPKGHKELDMTEHKHQIQGFLRVGTYSAARVAYPQIWSCMELVRNPKNGGE